MTLSRIIRAGGIVTAMLFLALIAVFLGNQRQTSAIDINDSLYEEGRMVCIVYTDNNGIGDFSFPAFTYTDDNCPDGQTPIPETACNDSIDNDGDGKTDYPNDPGCTSPSDDDETDPNNGGGGAPQCSDDVDNDTDGFTDEADPNCHTDGDATNDDSYDSDDDNESGALPACWNGEDDDGDSLIDFSNDPGCTSATDDDESNGGGGGGGGQENTLPLCSDGLDNDSDSLVDLLDPDCSGFMPKLVVIKIVVNDNSGTSTPSQFPLYIATSTSATTTVVSGATTTVSVGEWIVTEGAHAGYSASFGGDCNTSGHVTLAVGNTKTCIITNNDIAPSAPACSDGTDNDGDGKIDSVDPGCSGSDDNDETDPTTGGGGGSVQCSDGVDNDGDGKVDYPNDPGCASSGDDNETDPSSGGGRGGNNDGGGGSGSAIATQLNPNLGGGIGGDGGQVLGVTTQTPSTSCDAYITDFMRMGRANDPEQVKKLQIFLNQEMGANLPITGFFGPLTDATVRAFQLKYASDILAPWDITESTGYVYLTTRKKINEIYCQYTRQFPLTPAEQGIIEKSLLSGGSAARVGTPSPISTPPISQGPSPTLSEDAESETDAGTGQEATNTGEVAGARERNNQLIVAVLLLLTLLGAGVGWYFWQKDSAKKETT